MSRGLYTWSSRSLLFSQHGNHPLVTWPSLLQLSKASRASRAFGSRAGSPWELSGWRSWLGAPGEPAPRGSTPCPPHPLLLLHLLVAPSQRVGVTGTGRQHRAAPLAAPEEDERAGYDSRREQVLQEHLLLLFASSTFHSSSSFWFLSYPL